MTGLISLTLSGPAFARGQGQGQGGAAPVEQVREATLGRVAKARADGLIDAAALEYVAAQRQFHEAVDPEGLAELDGIAQGFGFDRDALFLHLHLGTLRDLKGGAQLTDGCSAWAVADGPDGPLVVKNRDFSGTHRGIQTLARHEGPDVLTGAMLCLGSLGSPGAYSSGINARGFALADTQVAVRSHRVGWLRYFLMGRLLARCATVAEALALIRAHPHAGGGTLVMADASGATAAVELGAAGPQISTGTLSMRTNHFVTPTLAGDTLPPSNDLIAGNSRDRLGFLATTLPGRDWDCAAAQALMATHPEAGAPICQHHGARDTATIASTVYACAARSVLVCPQNPCSGDWRAHSLT